MTRQLDATAVAAVSKLIDKVTDKHETHQDAAAVQQIKAFCKQSDENITWISNVLLHRLRQEHPQTRLHVVNLTDQLFQRSRAFRAQLTASFTDFLDLSVGFRPERPLPGPASIATQLRERALEIVEEWHDNFGSTYKQVSLGYNYLKNNMSMRFPEVRARAAAAAAETQERQVRSQALLQDKYQHICAGFAGHVADITSTLTQVVEGFTLIEGTTHMTAVPPPAAAAAAADQAAQNAAVPEDEIAWEVVESATPAAEVPNAASSDINSAEGLSAYAMDTIPEDLLQRAESGPSVGPEGINRVWVSLNNPNPALVENVQALAKLVANRHLPRVQGWLKVLVKVEVGEVGSQQHAQRERMLRSAIELQAQLKQSHEKLEALSQQLAESSDPEAQAADSSADATKGDSHSVKGRPNAAAAAIQQKSAALIKSLFGSDDEVDAAVGDGQEAQAKDIPAGKQPADSAASVAQQRRQSTAGAAQASGIDTSSHKAQHSTTAGPRQRLVDPAAPRRSISFSNSLRRCQASSIQQRRDAFNAAADAAALQAAAQRSTAGSQAADSSQAAAKPEGDESRQGPPGSISYTPLLGAKTGTDMPQAVKQHASLGTAGMPDQAIRVMPSAQSPQPSGTQDLPGGRVQSAAASTSPAMTGGLATQSHEEEAPKVITRTSQAEAAPKLKTGSRLAASMAKLAASKTAPNDLPTPAAAPAQQSCDGKKKGAIPEDVRQTLLAKAPVVAHGNDLVYWDSNNARALVNARGMEYQNHWGAHDPDVELPAEQLNAIFGTRAEYWTPSEKPQTVSGHPQQPPGHPQQPAPGLGRQSVGSVLSATGVGQSERQSAVPSAASKSSSAVGNVRAQRAADRAHNEAVIASTDEHLAQALADEEAQAAVKASSGPGRGTKRKPQPGVRERLAQKLLSARARGQTLGEVESAADERFQEANSNRWQATRFP